MKMGITKMKDSMDWFHKYLHPTEKKKQKLLRRTKRKKSNEKEKRNGRKQKIQ